MSIDFVVVDSINVDADDDDDLECRICRRRHKSSIIVMTNPELQIRSTRCCCSCDLIDREIHRNKK